MDTISGGWIHVFNALSEEGSPLLLSGGQNIPFGECIEWSASSVLSGLNKNWISFRFSLIVSGKMVPQGRIELPSLLLPIGFGSFIYLSLVALCCISHCIIRIALASRLPEYVVDYRHRAYSWLTYIQN